VSLPATRFFRLPIPSFAVSPYTFLISGPQGIAQTKKRKNDRPTKHRSFSYPPNRPKGAISAIMIRLFAALCKTLAENIYDDETIFQEATDGFRHHGEKCPLCGASGKLTGNGKYSRILVSLAGGRPADHRVSPRRFVCASCGSTHALLPDILIPYSPYSLRFKLTVLAAYFEKMEAAEDKGAKETPTVMDICERFGIAISTLYEWKKRLLEHKECLLGVLASQKTPALAFLRGLFGSGRLPDALRGFFRRHGFSFMQARSPMATRYCPP
jgi:transposase-like protein